MKLRHRVFAYLAAAHALFFVLAIIFVSIKPWHFVVAEVLIVVSFVGGYFLINHALKPLEFTQRFHDLLQDHHYAARFQPLANTELNESVQLFNRMLAELYDERLRLGEQRGFLEQLLQATPSAVVVFDFEQRISLMNTSAQRLFAVSDYQGRAIDAWAQDDFVWIADADEQAKQRSRHLMQQLKQLAQQENRLLVDPFGHRYRCQHSHFFDRGFARDFWLIDELTEELESSEKTTYEKLVRVLAHEVNNTVAATGSVLESLLFYQAQLQTGDRDDFVTAITAVRKRNAGLGEFIDRFAHVVKLPAPQRRDTLAIELLSPIEQLYREPFRLRGIALQWRHCARAARINVDKNLLEQALINIIKNAMEAVESSLRETPSMAAYIALELVQETHGVRLSICDSANRLQGVPSEQLFTPFFTTKKGGQGIGLLLVREVLNRHNADYRLSANDKNETQFDIWFR